MAYTRLPVKPRLYAKTYEDIHVVNVEKDKGLRRAASSEPLLVNLQSFTPLTSSDESQKSLPESCLQSVQAYIDQAKDLWCCFSNTFVNKQNKLLFPRNEKNEFSYEKPSKETLCQNISSSLSGDLSSSSKTAPIGFSFSPAGLLLPYHLGVIHCLIYFGILNDHVPLAGASAGAIAVSAVACSVQVRDVLEALLRAQSNLRATGAARKLHMSLEDQLNATLPENAHLKINSRPAPVTIAYATVWPYVKGHFPCHFESFKDLKECIIASCNIPFYFSRWPTVNCRGHAAVDGYFASTRNFGCAKTGAARDVYVIPFSIVSMHLPVSLEDCISPDIQQYDSFFYKEENKMYLDVFKKYMHQDSFDNMISSTDAHTHSEQYLTSTSASQSSLFGSYGTLRKWVQFEEPQIKTEAAAEEIDSNTTSSSIEKQIFLTLPVLKYSISMLLKIALDPVSDQIMIDIFNLGRADCYRWLVRETILYGELAILTPQDFLKYV